MSGNESREIRCLFPNIRQEFFFKRFHGSGNEDRKIRVLFPLMQINIGCCRKWKKGNEVLISLNIGQERTDIIWFAGCFPEKKENTILISLEKKRKKHILFELLPVSGNESREIRSHMIWTTRCFGKWKKGNQILIPPIQKNQRNNRHIVWVTPCFGKEGK